MTESTPSVVVIAGPNGAGKSTIAVHLLRGALGVNTFVNADTIALGLSAFDPEGASLAAGRVMLGRIKSLAERRERFAFETTLATRSFAPWLDGLTRNGYAFHLVFLWLPSPDLAVARVADRVTRGGHHVPETTVRRRFERGLRNFFLIYRPVATTWRFYDNALEEGPRLIASGTRATDLVIAKPTAWAMILADYSA